MSAAEADRREPRRSRASGSNWRRLGSSVSRDGPPCRAVTVRGELLPWTRSVAAFAERAAEQTYGASRKPSSPEAPWSAIDLEKLWRAEHPTVAPWFAGSGLSSRIPKEACRLRAAGLKNWWRVEVPVNEKAVGSGSRSWRKRKHGSRFRYDADRAHPAGPSAVTLPGIPGKVRDSRRPGLADCTARRRPRPDHRRHRAGAGRTVVGDLPAGRRPLGHQRSPGGRARTHRRAGSTSG